MDSFDNHSITSLNTNAYHSVMPLQSLTNEGYSVCYQELNGTAEAGSASYASAALSGALQGSMGLQDVRAIQSVSNFPGD